MSTTWWWPQKNEREHALTIFGISWTVPWLFEQQFRSPDAYTEMASLYWKSTVTVKEIADQYGMKEYDVIQWVPSATAEFFRCIVCDKPICEDSRKGVIKRSKAIISGRICCANCELEIARSSYKESGADAESFLIGQTVILATSVVVPDELRRMRYSDYLATDHWNKTRLKALKRSDFKCQVCNTSSELQVHHRTYKRLGAEKPSDLTVLCDVCHGLFHERSRLAG